MHLTSSEVRAGSMIESSLLYEHPSRIVEEKSANQVSNFYVGKISVVDIFTFSNRKSIKSINELNFQVIDFNSDVVQISRPSTTSANSIEDNNDAGSSYSSVDDTAGGGGPTRTNL